MPAPTRIRFPSLAQWLDWQQSLHPRTIDLGLARVNRVLHRTGWRRPAAAVITVGGTNGKGSCVALLDSILRAAGRRVGCFTSPHLVDYRERIRLDGRWVSEASLVAAFERIADALDDDSLTFFEFNTLAALLVFETARPDVVLLEVGLGGRLDAVNAVDPDVAVVVSVSLDHTEYLGPDVESIGREKAGIFRGDRPAICGMPDPPQSLVARARQVGALLRLRGQDFDGVRTGSTTWSYRGSQATFDDLPLPALAGATQVHNAAVALAALEPVAARLQVDRTAIERGLRTAALDGRFQRIDDRRGFEWRLDVAHNADSARVLAANLREFPVSGRTLAVCGMLGDKDVAGVLDQVRGSCDAWFAATTGTARGLTDTELAARARASGIEMDCAGPVVDALGRAASQARPGDRIVVFGSFHTVGPALSALRDHL